MTESRVSEPNQKPRRRLRRRRRKARRFRWWALLLLAVLLGAAGLFWWEFSPQSGADTKEVVQETSDTPIYILLIGSDDGAPAEADTLALLAYNPEKERAAVISVLPNTALQPTEGEAYPIRSLLAQGGIPRVKEGVETLFHIYIPYYVRLQPANLAAFLDRRGAVPLYVEETMYHEDAGYTTINLAQGYRELTGKEAVSYLRYRGTPADDLGRVQRQQRFMKIYAAQMRHHYGWVNRLYTYFLWGYTESNISPYDAGRLASGLTALPEDNWEYYIVPGEQTGELWEPNPIGIQTIIGQTIGMPAPKQEEMNESGHAQ
ncbi:MAG: LCP family protein [Veillonellaceae bacterium]|nr:LCP family protein [Veillonellaceae bacterium]